MKILEQRGTGDKQIAVKAEEVCIMIAFCLFVELFLIHSVVYQAILHLYGNIFKN